MRQDSCAPTPSPALPPKRGREGTAFAAAHDTGLPPKVLKYMTFEANSVASASRATTPETGCPLAIGLPSVTMSGTTP